MVYPSGTGLPMNRCLASGTPGCKFYGKNVSLPPKHLELLVVVLGLI